MSKQISALMLSSDEGLWERYCEILERKNYVILLLPAKQIERCKQAIREQELIILDIPDDKKEWIEIVKTIHKILGEKKPLLVVSNLEEENVAKILNAGASDHMRRLVNEEPFVAGVTNLMKRYQLNQRQ